MIDPARIPERVLTAAEDGWVARCCLIAKGEANQEMRWAIAFALDVLMGSDEPVEVLMPGNEPDHLLVRPSCVLEAVLNRWAQSAPQRPENHGAPH